MSPFFCAERTAYAFANGKGVAQGKSATGSLGVATTINVTSDADTASPISFVAIQPVSRSLN